MGTPRCCGPATSPVRWLRGRRCRSIPRSDEGREGTRRDAVNSVAQRPLGAALRGSAMNKRTNRPAFTLIELLTVIAIIAILAAILFPVFAKAREKANQTSCLSNNKQIALGFQMYAQDYDQRLPGLWGDVLGIGQYGGGGVFFALCGV